MNSNDTDKNDPMMIIGKSSPQHHGGTKIAIGVTSASTAPYRRNNTSSNVIT